MGVKRPISFGLQREEVNGREQRKQRFFGFIDIVAHSGRAFGPVAATSPDREYWVAVSRIHLHFGVVLINGALNFQWLASQPQPERPTSNV